MSQLMGRVKDVPYTSFTGKLIRLPLRLIPKGLAVPVLSGRLRGTRWVVGAGNHSCWLGFYERGKQETFSSAIPPGATVYDIGAHAGYYTILFAKLVGPTGRVVAFEPLPRNLKNLNRHLAINRISNVEVVPAAVSISSGTASFSESPSSYAGALRRTGTTEVRTVRLDDVSGSEGFPPPDFVKIDVEGAEDSVLTGALATISLHRPMIFLATHGPDVDARCVATLEGLGYWLEEIPGDPLEFRELAAHPAKDRSS